MELELNLQSQELQKKDNNEKQNNIDNDNSVELLVKQEATVENQNSERFELSSRIMLRGIFLTKSRG